MLGRRREQILIIVGLIGLNVLLGWSLGRLRKDYRSRTQWLYVAAPAQRPAKPAVSAEQRGQPQSFVEIVDRNVFSPLRGSPPPQSQEEAKAPRPPLLFGTMNLGDGWFALMAAGDQPPQASKRVLPGEEIGGYKLVSIGVRNVVIEWQDKKITLDISESAHRVPDMGERTASASPRPAAVTTVGSASNSATTARPFTGPFNSAAKSSPNPPPPDAPVGTVIDGKRKILIPTLFGTAAVWQPVGQPESATTQQTGNPNK